MNDGVLWERGTAVKFGHPPARCARVPLRGAKGGGGLGVGAVREPPLRIGRRERGGEIEGRELNLRLFSLGHAVAYSRNREHVGRVATVLAQL